VGISCCGNMMLKLLTTRKKITKSLNNCSGFSLLEIIVVIIIISILFGLALNQLFKWRITAEKTSITKLISEMQNSLKLEVVSYYAKGRMQYITKLVGSNPLDYAVEKPDTYIGEQAKPDIKNVKPGSWVFDTSKRLLIYRVRYPDYFITKLTGIKRIELKVSLIYADINKNSKFNRAVDTVEGLRLISTEEYDWK
jgi:prepilin-type N-terminal cleavage/methylation domain-containing protein